MMEVWGILGRVFLDPGFHDQLFTGAKRGWRFEELVEFRSIIRKQLRLNLSRWEVMVVHRSITERHQGLTLPVDPVGSAGSDPEIIEIRRRWGGPVPVFFGDFDLCAVVGLASVDITFRRDLYEASDSSPDVGIQKLHSLLTNPPKESPTFDRLSEQNFFNLNAFLRSEGIIEFLERFHVSRWVQPNTFPCDGGYTDTPNARYQFFSQPDLVKLVQTNPEIREALLAARALQ
jgi:hypothetical protein